MYSLGFCPLPPAPTPNLDNLYNFFSDVGERPELAQNGRQGNAPTILFGIWINFPSHYLRILFYLFCWIKIWVWNVQVQGKFWFKTEVCTWDKLGRLHMQCMCGSSIEAFYWHTYFEIGVIFQPTSAETLVFSWNLINLTLIQGSLFFTVTGRM